MQIKKQIKIIIKNYTENIIYPYGFFGWFGIITYPLFYFIWRYTSHVGYENLYLRLVVSVLCIPLAAKNFWPTKIKSFLPYYWYIVLLYCLPFLFSFLLLKNNFSFSSSLNFLTITALSVLLIEWEIVVILFLLGISLACLVFNLFIGPIILPPNFGTLPITCLAIMIFGALFSRNIEVAKQTKIQLQTVKSMATNIAHELRTPLRSISSYAAGINENLPYLFAAYKKADAAKLDIPKIFPTDFTTLQHAVKSIETETRDAFTVINMLIFASGMADALIEKEATKPCSIIDCVETALQRYPFDLRERKLIHWSKEENKVHDFQFNGKELILVHVIFNLLKNALYHIKKAGKGEIFIWLDSVKNNNYLHFKDTGTGISKKDIHHIFEQFYSKTAHGTGIGLAFCKAVMQSLDGNIKCFSIENEFTEFLLKFPIDKTIKKF